MKEGKVIYRLHILVDLFTVRFQPDRVAKICDKLQSSIVCQSFKRMQRGTGTPNLLPILFTWSHFVIVQVSNQPVNIVKTDLHLHWQNILSFFTVKSAKMNWYTYSIHLLLLSKIKTYVWVGGKKKKKEEDTYSLPGVHATNNVNRSKMHTSHSKG